MQSFLTSLLLLLATGLNLGAIDAPRFVAQRSGDLCVTLHWSGHGDSSPAGYRVYRADSNTGPFALQAELPSTSPRWCDFNVRNGSAYSYKVRALGVGGQASQPSDPITAIPRPFDSEDSFLAFLQQAHFDYFWFGANPTNGLVPDRSSPTSPCSIAAVGFGLTAITIGIDHGWITREQGLERVLTTLRTFWELPQGPGATGTIGYRGWFYHFLDMHSGLRFTRFDTELSSIDTALFLAGALDVRQYFDGKHAKEHEVRRIAQAIFDRVDWAWLARRGSDVLSMGWKPGSGFLNSTWVGYNEAMILYLMAMGARSNALPASSWQQWTRGYAWRTNHGQQYVEFAPLFGHQYSHCWVDFRGIADDYLCGRGISYFENSRRATLAQRAYCIANPAGHKGYSSNVWGLTACDGPQGYSARGAPPPENDDGTVAPTAAGGSVPFAPEVCIPTLRHFYQEFRRDIWTPLGFRDAFNQGAGWWASDTLGIDQGPIVIMIENHRTERVWRRFMKNPEIQQGLKRADFTSLEARKPQR